MGKFIYFNTVDAEKQETFTIAGDDLTDAVDYLENTLSLLAGDIVGGVELPGTSITLIEKSGPDIFSNDIEIEKEKGVILSSPDNSRFRIVVANDGTLSTTSI